MFPNIDEHIFELFKEMEGHKHMMLSASCPHSREYHKNNLMNTIETVSSFINVLNRISKYDYENSMKRDEEQLNINQRQKVFTLEELAQYDGAGGRPAYVAVNNTVYDVSNNPTWGGGSHFGLIAGKDLTGAFDGCHGVKEILNKLPIVGSIANV